MKSLFAVAKAQRDLHIAGAGLSFVSALIFCGALVIPKLRFFPPFQNEFLSLARLLLWFTAFLIGYSHAPARKTRSTFYCFWLRYCFGLVPLLFLCFPHFFQTKYFHLFGWAFFFVPVGLFAGELRQYVVRPVHYLMSCLAGAAAGVMFAWLLRLRPGLIGPNRVLFLMLFILLWVIFRRIWQWKCGRLVRIVSMILWGLCIVYPCCRLVPFYLCGKSADERQITPAELAMSGLQPGRKGLNILIVSDSRTLTDGMGSFPLTRKLLAVSPRNMAGLSRLLDHADGEFDLIVLELPVPDNLYALRMYSAENLEKIRQALDEDGVLAVLLPDDILLEPDLNRRFGLHDLTGSILKTIFPSVKIPGGDFPILFCGGSNVTNSPKELNRRARELKLMPAYLPDGVFALLPPPEPASVQADTGLQGLDLMWQVIRKQDSVIKWTGLGGLLDGIRCVLLQCLTGLLVLMLVIRYFFSGGTENKRSWLSMENGLYFGLTAVLLLVPYQLNTGRLDPDWLSLTGIFLIAAFAGMLASVGRHHSALLRKLLLGVSLLAPWCGLVFLYGYYRPDPLVYYALAGYVGYTSGMTAADTRSEWNVTLTGFCIGLLLGGLLCWVPEGMVLAPVLAVLCRIPPLAAENLQKRFEKSSGRG